MAVVFCDVEQANLQREYSKVYPGLFRRRRMAAEERIILPAAAVKQLPGGYGIGRLSGRK